MKVKPLILSIEKKLWDDFKSIVPRTTTLNGTVVSLVEAFVKKTMVKQTNKNDLTTNK